MTREKKHGSMVVGAWPIARDVMPTAAVLFIKLGSPTWRGWKVRRQWVAFTREH